MPEDRDQLFEKALQRHLRAGAQKEFLCPDAELLAAYHQKTLAREEMVATEAHLAACARCAEILAQLRSSEAVMELAAEPATAAVREAATPERATPISKSRSWWLGTLVPAGAIAAALLLWIGTTVLRTRPEQSAAPAAVADNRQEPAAGRDSSEALKSAEVEKPVLEERTAPPAADQTLGPSERGNLREYSRRAAVPSPPGPVGAARPAQSPASPPASASGSRELPERRAAGQATAQAEVSSEAPAAATVPAPSQPANSVASAPPSESAAAAKARNQVAPALLEKKDAQDSEFSISAGFTAARTVPVRIAAPGGRRIWSVGNNGLILFSKDAGRTWMRQFAAVQSALTAGSAPSEEVCWIAGAAGTLLRTTDAGQHWQSVATPIDGDLGGVQAADAQHAAIWDLLHNTRYQTSDGGATWKPAANE
jgi:hypothetical protein